MSDYAGYFVSFTRFYPADWHGYHVYFCGDGYRIWTYKPAPWDVKGMVPVDIPADI